jgi:hypothetical protein
MVVVALPVLVGGALGLAGLGAGLGAMLFGGGTQTQAQEQDIAQKTRAETEIKAPQDQIVKNVFDQRSYDYSKQTQETIANITNSPNAGIYTTPDMQIDKPQSLVPEIKVEQIPTQTFDVKTDVTPKQEAKPKAESTATQPSGANNLLLYAVIGGAGYIGYKEFIAKKGKKK